MEARESSMVSSTLHPMAQARSSARAWQGRPLRSRAFPLPAALRECIVLRMAPAITSATVVRPAEGHLATDLDKEIVLMSVATGEYFGIRGAGVAMWKELRLGPRSVRELVARVTAEYRVAEERAEADLLKLLADMHRRGLVEIAG